MVKKIYVGNLPWTFTTSELEALFREFGAIRSAEVIMDRATGKSRGFGFVEMESDSDAMSAIESLNGRDVGGRALVANEARERAPRTGGGYGGGRGRDGGHRDGGRGGRGYGGGNYGGGRGSESYGISER